MRLVLQIILIFFYASWSFAQDVLEIPATKTKKAISCPLEGNPKAGHKKAFYEAKNRLKNRYNFPESNDFDQTVSLEAMLGDGTYDKQKFNEQRSASIEGYIVYVSPSPWAESCNCGTILSDYSDIHVEIAGNPDEEKGGRTVVVELTPRIRLKQGASWSRKKLKELWENKTRVKISGWLFYDEEHEPQSRNVVGDKCEEYNNRRQTCWEIHPITEIREAKGRDPESASVSMPEKPDTVSKAGTTTSPCNLNHNSCCCCNGGHSGQADKDEPGYKVLFATVISLLAAVLLALINSWIQQVIERKKEKRVKAAELVSALATYIDYIITTSWYPPEELPEIAQSAIKKLIKLKSDVVKARSVLAAFDLGKYYTMDSLVSEAVELDTDISNILVAQKNNRDIISSDEGDTGKSDEDISEKGQDVEAELERINEESRELLKKLHEVVAKVMKQ